MNSFSVRWAAVDRLHWREWEGSALVYQEVSGSTHLLNPLSARVLSSIAAGASAADEIADRVARELDLEPDDSVRSQVDIVLSRLRESGLIEPAER